MTDVEIECDDAVDGAPGLSPCLVDDLLQEIGLAQILAQSMPDLIYVKDARCRYVFSNASHLRFVGATGPQDVLGKTSLELFPRDVAEPFYRADRAILETGRALVHMDVAYLIDTFGGEPRVPAEVAVDTLARIWGAHCAVLATGD